jgi:hypothetical protein
MLKGSKGRMNRSVEPEWLDELPAGDPGAMGSRRDLRRLNRWMGNARAMEQALRSFPSAARPVRLAELGAGDGDFLLQVARRLGSAWRGTQATLVDLQDLVTAETAGGFTELGWNMNVSSGDVFDWCRQTGAGSRGLILANLFLHHFGSEQLQELLGVIRQRCIFFVAIEPRRSLISLAFSKLVRFIGCNAVTRHDAPASVRAGFFGRELSGLWPGNGEWITQERRVGPFSHLFAAEKRIPPQTVRGP